MINYTSQKISKVLGLITLIGFSTFLEAQDPSNWAPAGPVYNAGRARNMIIDKSSPNILYVGSASSGIFKSTTTGTNWEPINDQAKVRNISYLAQGSDGIIYAGTGEGFLRSGQKAKAQIGTGFYKLDETVTPAQLVMVASSSVVGTVINRVACSPLLPTHIALATNLGIFVSTNGTSFSSVTLPGAPTGTAISGQDLKFDSNGILYCTIGSEAGTGNASNASKVYKASDANFSSFTNITPVSSLLVDNFYGRIELAIAPSNANIIYASCANKYLTTNSASSTLKGLFVSYDGGTSWGLILQGSAQLDPLSNGASRASGDYAHVITVDPANPNVIYIAGYRFYTFERTGGSDSSPIGNWYNIGQSFSPTIQNYLHENIHDIKLTGSFNATGTKMFFITDAGVFRSIDKAQSFQPFYKGLVTGQYNSVSIERYPVSNRTDSSGSGFQVNPHIGFIGGTGGNGLTYFSGRDTLVTKEYSYIAGEIYNSEYSKILSNAAFATNGNGGLYRSSDIRTSDPVLVNVNAYSGGLSVIAPNPSGFSNSNVTTGTPFKLWENYGKVNPTPDSAVFYNDTLRFGASMVDVTELTSKSTFTFSASRPNIYAQIDSISVRTATVQLPIDGQYKDCQTPFTGKDRQMITAKLDNNYSTTNSITVLSTSNTTGPILGPATFTLNKTTLLDDISITFTAPPFSTKTITQYPTTGNAVVTNPAAYYRVFATIYYKYLPGSVVQVVDNNISTITNTYTSVIPVETNWRYGSFPSYVIASTPTPAVTSPTYVLIPNAPLSQVETRTTTTNVFTVSPYCTTTYTMLKYGTFTLSAKPVVYSVTAVPISYTIAANSVTTAANVAYTLQPGNVVQSGSTSIVVFTVSPTSTSVSANTYTIYTPGTGTTVTSQTYSFASTSFAIIPPVNTLTTSAANKFIVSPTVTTNYTVTQTTGTLTQDTYSTVGTTTYVLNPGNITKEDTTQFVVNTGIPASYTVPISYTLSSISSNSLAGSNTPTTYLFPISNSSVINFVVPFSKNNKTVKTPTRISARLACILTNNAITAGATAIVVSKNPLALNDPLNFVRVSQTGVFSDDANGNPTTNTISIPGKPVLLEWSKSGTEIYYATSDNKLYRVSHITDIMDLSPSSYSGKFFTDVFKYASPINSSTLNLVSPYRTTLIGSFDKPISAISVSNDNKNLAITFNGASTGTTGTIMYNTNDARVSDVSNIAWVNKEGTGLVNTITYCSLMEKNDNKKVFVGTDNGMYYTADITASSPTWNNINNNQLPSVQIFDIKQQILDPHDCYNSGQIYVATYGRGVWINSTYFTTKYAVGVNEESSNVSVGNNLSLYPNPTNGLVNVLFNSVEGETASISIMDISGRMVKTEDIGKLNSSEEVSFAFETSDLKAGVYIVNINSNSGVKRVSKLIVTK